jgi:transposase, IS5 family
MASAVLFERHPLERAWCGGARGERAFDDVGGAQILPVLGREVVYARCPNDADLLIPAIATHEAKLGRVPGLVAADAAFYSGRNETGGESNGRQTRVRSQSVEQESRPQTRAEAQRPEMAHRMRRTSQRGQRPHGLNRCRYKNEVGMQRWVGLGVISDNLLNIGRAMSQRAAT